MIIWLFNGDVSLFNANELVAASLNKSQINI